MDMEKIGRYAGRLMIRRDAIYQHMALRPCAVMLPASEFTLCDDGEVQETEFCGLPVVWSDRAALLYDF